METLLRDVHFVIDHVGPKTLVATLVGCGVLGAFVGLVKEASHSYRRAYGAVPPEPSAAKR